MFLQTLKVLDREEIDTHILIVKASEDCLNAPSSDTSIEFDPHDDTLLRVVAKVNDVNDNSPQFSKKIFSGGVTTEADFGVEFMQIKVGNIGTQSCSSQSIFLIKFAIFQSL